MHLRQKRKFENSETEKSENNQKKNLKNEEKCAFTDNSRLNHLENLILTLNDKNFYTNLQNEIEAKRDIYCTIERHERVAREWVKKEKLLSDEILELKRKNYELGEQIIRQNEIEKRLTSELDDANVQVCGLVADNYNLNETIKGLKN